MNVLNKKSELDRALERRKDMMLSSRMDETSSNVHSRVKADFQRVVQDRAHRLGRVRFHPRNLH